MSMPSEHKEDKEDPVQSGPLLELNIEEQATQESMVTLLLLFVGSWTSWALDHTIPYASAAVGNAITLVLATLAPFSNITWWLAVWLFKVFVAIRLVNQVALYLGFTLNGPMSDNSIIHMHFRYGSGPDFHYSRQWCGVSNLMLAGAAIIALSRLLPF